MKREFALIWRDRSKPPSWVDEATALEWAEKKESGGGTIKVAEGHRVDVHNFVEVVAKNVFEDRGKEHRPSDRDLPPQQVDNYGMALVELIKASRSDNIAARISREGAPKWVKPHHLKLIAGTKEWEALPTRDGRKIYA